MKLDADEKQLLESAERGRVEVRPRWQGREASTALLPRYLQNHVWPVLGAVPIARMARGDVKRLLVGLRAKELRAKTVTGILRTLSTVLSEAVEDGNLPAKSRAPSRPPA